MDEIEFTPERVVLHQCRCLIPPKDRCQRLVPLDQPVCDGCEDVHFGEGLGGTMVPLGQP